MGRGHPRAYKETTLHYCLRLCCSPGRGECWDTAGDERAGGRRAARRIAMAYPVGGFVPQAGSSSKPSKLTWVRPLPSALAV